MNEEEIKEFIRQAMNELMDEGMVNEVFDKIMPRVQAAMLPERHTTDNTMDNQSNTRSGAYNQDLENSTGQSTVSSHVDGDKSSSISNNIGKSDSFTSNSRPRGLGMQETNRVSPGYSRGGSSEQVYRLSQDLAKYQRELTDCKGAYKKLEREYKALKKEHDDINATLSDWLEKASIRGVERMGLWEKIISLFTEQNKQSKSQINRAEQERDQYSSKWKQLNDAYQALEIERDNLVDDYKQATKSYNELHQVYSQIQEDYEKVKKVKESLEEQIRNGFGTGQAIFQDVKQLPATYTDYLQAEIIFKDLEGFIISSTLSPRTLQRIWQSAYDAIVTHQDEASYQVLWSYFQYACYLYNNGRKDDIIEIFDTQVGDNYDPRDYDSDRNSAPRGTVQRVYIQGFKNAFSDERLAKSYVHVG